MDSRFLTSFHVPLSADIARCLSDEALEFSCYARKVGYDGHFDRMVMSVVKELYKDPAARDVFQIDQTAKVSCATHVIELNKNPLFGGAQVGTVFLQSSKLSNHPVNEPHFFTVLLVDVPESERRKGFGTILMKLVRQLSIEIVRQNPVIREEVASLGNKFQIVAYVPKVNPDTPENFVMHNGFFSSLQFTSMPTDNGFTFGALEDDEIPYRFEVDLSERPRASSVPSITGTVCLFKPITPPPNELPSRVLTGKGRKRVLSDVDAASD